MAIEGLIEGLDELRNRVLDDVDAIHDSFGLRLVWDRKFREILDRLRKVDKLIDATHSRPDLIGIDVSTAFRQARMSMPPIRSVAHVVQYPHQRDDGRHLLRLECGHEVERTALRKRTRCPACSIDGTTELPSGEK